MARSDSDGVATAKVTMVGQSSSGKTNLLATLLQNRKSWFDIQTGWDGISDIGMESSAPEGSPSEADMNVLDRQFKAILSGRDFDAEGTDTVRHYPFTLKFTSHVRKKKRLVGIATGGTHTVSEHQSIRFDVVDGRGGDLAPPAFVDPNDPENEDQLSRRAEYVAGLDESVGVLVCMPIKDEEFDTTMATKLVDTIVKTIKRRKRANALKPLERIALCFTKYDLLFSQDGTDAGHQALDPGVVIEQLSGQTMFEVFRPLFNEQKQSSELDIRVFPASTLGFINGAGAANYYDYQHAPGLLTRRVTPEIDYDDPDLNPDAGREGKSTYQDHFPFQITEQAASSQWQPFNIAPPLVYALTGRLTGPLHLSPDEFNP